MHHHIKIAFNDATSQRKYKLSNSNENVLIRVLDIDVKWRKGVYIGINLFFMFNNEVSECAK